MKFMNNRQNNIVIILLLIFVAGIIFLPVLISTDAGLANSAVESVKSGNMTIVYCVMAFLSLLLLVGYSLLKKQHNRQLIALFSCVAAANCGYLFISLSRTVTGAMMANRLSYVGSAYSIMVLLMIIMDVCHIDKKKWINHLLLGISTTAFLLAASGDWFGLYYKAVGIETVNGVTKLVKVYGPLHTLYPLYLLSYFAVMVFVIISAVRKKKLASPKYAAFLVLISLTNLIVWAVEQAIDIDFEFLSVSYIFTEVMLLAIYSMLQDYDIIQPSGNMISVEMLTKLNTRYVTGELPPNMESLFRSFAERVSTLSTAEHRILDYYIDGCEIADIPELDFISIHTVKKHNRSIYQKLQVASRDELMLYIELFRCCDRLDELSSGNTKAE